MIITLRKRQLTYQQKREVVAILLQYGLVCVGAAVRHAQCCTRTVWNIWAQYQSGGRTDEAVALKPRHSKHPSEHTTQERALIVQVLAEFPTAGYTKLYTELFKRGYARSYKGMWGYIHKHKLRGDVYAEHAYHVLKPYSTPSMLGFKWQMDIKYVEARYSTDGKKYYQYTMIDESTRCCFEMAFAEKSTYSTKTFILFAIRHFGYIPLQIQTDNGTEFTNKLIATKADSMINLVDALLDKLHIEHKLIRPATPRHDGKVERRHREDQRHYSGKKFADLAELNEHIAEWCAEKDDTFTFALCPQCRKSPNMKHAEQIQELRRFAIYDLKLNRNPKLQELIYAYAEWTRIKQEREESPPLFILKLPEGIHLAPDIQYALARL